MVSPQGVFFNRVVSHQGVLQQGGLSSGCSFFQQGRLSSVFVVVDRIVSHQGVFVNRVVSPPGVLFPTGSSLIIIFFFLKGGLSSGWSVIRVIFISGSTMSLND